MVKMKKEKIISSLIFKFIEKFATKGIGLIIGIILARLLDPEHFGQLAILMVFINLSITIIEGGLNAALIQKKDADEIDFSVVFYISLAISILIVLVLFFAAPYIASFYGEPEIIWPLRVYSFVLIIGSFNSVQVAKMQKEMRFRATMFINLIATILAGALGLVLAFLNFGLWALVIYNFSYIVFVTLIMMFVVKWFPKPCFSFERAKTLFGFGWKMLLSGVIYSLYGDIRSLIIGKRFDVDSLGYYDKGKQYPEVIAVALDQSIRSVMFPAMSIEQDNKERVRGMMKKFLTLGTFLIAPLMVGIALVAEPFVVVVLTEKWLPIVFYLQMIALGYISLPIVSANIITIKSMGRSDLYLILEIIRVIIMVTTLLVSILCFNTVEAIAVGFVVGSFLDCISSMIPMKKFINYGLFSQVKDLLKIFLAVGLMALCVWGVSFLPISSMLWMLIIQILVGVVTYVLFCALIKVESFYYVFNLLKKFFIKGKKNNKQVS